MLEAVLNIETRVIEAEIIIGGPSTPTKPILIDFTEALDFSKYEQYFEPYTQTGVLSFTLAGSSFGPNANINGSITANGDAWNFSDDFIVMRNDYEALEAAYYDVIFMLWGDGKVRVIIALSATIDHIPVAENVAFTGTEQVGQTLTGTYDYVDSDGDPESGTTFKWYRADDGTGTNETAISGATSQSYELTETDEGKYIRFGVTPANGVAIGVEAFSGYSGEIQAESQSLFQYSAEGTVIDTGKLTLTTGIYPDAITQNDELIFNCNEAGAFYDAKIESVSSFDASGDLVIRLSKRVISGADVAASVSFRFGFYRDISNVIDIIFNADTSTNVFLIIKEGGTNILATTIVRSSTSDVDFKIVKLADGKVKFYYWDGSAWSQLGTTTSSGFTTGTMKFLATVSNASEKIYAIKDIEVTDFDYETQFP